MLFTFSPITLWTITLMTSGSLETITPSEDTTVDKLINTAINSAIKEDLKHEPETLYDYAVIRAGAIERMIMFGEHIHSGILKIMRDMEQEMGYAQLGFESLQEWVHSLALAENQTDTLLRLARAVERIFILTDQQQWMTEDGEIINSDLLIEKASPSALMKMSYSFSECDQEKQEIIVKELLTGTSNARQIKKNAGVIADIVLEAFVEIQGDNKLYRFTLTPQDEAFLIERLKGSLSIHFVSPED
jgi:hypothetical protein